MGRMNGVEPVAQVFLGAGVTTAFHPFSYTKTLVQVKYPQREMLEYFRVESTEMTPSNDVTVIRRDLFDFLVDASIFFLIVQDDFALNLINKSKTKHAAITKERIVRGSTLL